MKIAIVGAGSAGLFTAWYLTQLSSGHEISVFDKGEPGGGATWKAAGMLAPVHELEFQEIDLLKAGIASQSLYFKEVAPALGDIGLKQQGALEVAIGQDDAAYLRRQFEFQQSQGLPVTWLSGAAIQEMEPFVSHAVSQAIYSATDTQVDNWLLVRRLVDDLLARGVTMRRQTEVSAWAVGPGNAVQVRVNGEMETFDRLLLATGVPQGAIAGQLPYKIYPVRGEMLSLEALEGTAPGMQVRIVSKVLGNAYIVPKQDRILLGSTSEEQGMAAFNTAGGLYNILRKCYAVIPSIFEMKVQETWAGLRPSTLNRLPILGQEEGKPIFHLNGLYRHGILLGPLLGKSAAQLLLGQDRLPETTDFILPKPPIALQ